MSSGLYTNQQVRVGHDHNALSKRVLRGVMTGVIDPEP